MNQSGSDRGEIGCLIALDVGDNRVGVAVSDKLGILASPHSVINRKVLGNDKSAGQIVRLAKELGATAIVVGIPLELSGEFGAQAAKTTKYIEAIRKKIDDEPALESLKIVNWDERLTSKQAERMVSIGSARRGQRRNKELGEAVDQASAVILLESYLTSLRTGSNKVDAV